MKGQTYYVHTYIKIINIINSAAFVIKTILYDYNSTTITWKKKLSFSNI